MLYAPMTKPKKLAYHQVGLIW